MRTLVCLVTLGCVWLGWTSPGWSQREVPPPCRCADGFTAGEFRDHGGPAIRPDDQAGSGCPRQEARGSAPHSLTCRGRAPA